MAIDTLYQKTNENTSKLGFFSRLTKLPHLRSSKNTITKLATFFAVQMSALTGVASVYAQEYQERGSGGNETEMTQVDVQARKQQNSIGADIISNQTKVASVSDTNLEKKKSIEDREVDGIDHDQILLDDFHSLKGGLTMRNGRPIITYPSVDPKSEKQYLMVLTNIDGGGSNLSSLVDSNAGAYLTGDYKRGFTTARQFISNNQEVLSDGNLSDAEKRRIYYATAFMGANLVKWKYVDSSKKIRVIDESFTEQEKKDCFSNALSQLKNLAATATEDEKPDAQRLYDEARIILSAGWDIGAIRYLIGEKDAIKKDVTREMHTIDYVTIVADASSYLEGITAKFEAGEISRSDFTMTLHMMDTILSRQLAIHKGIINRGWYTNDHDASELSYDDVKDQAMVSSTALVRSMGNALKALETGNSVQQSRAVVDMSLKIVELATLISKDSYSLSDMKGVPSISQPMSAEELGLTVTALVKNSEAVLAMYTPERLALNTEVPTQLASLRTEFSGYFAERYAGLQNAQSVGPQLTALFAGVEKKIVNEDKVWFWTEAQKKELKDLYSIAMASPSEEAKKDFYKAVTDQTVHENDPKRTLTPYSEIGQKVNFQQRTITQEDENGVRTETTEHPVMQYTEVREVYSDLPFDFYMDVTFSLEGMGIITDNYKHTERILVKAGKYATVTFTANISVVSEDKVIKPDFEMVIANNGFLFQTADNTLPTDDSITSPVRVATSSTGTIDQNGSTLTDPETVNAELPKER